MSSTLKQKAVVGIFWSFIERFGTQIVLLITQIVLARLLTPFDFGLIGMLVIFIAISRVFIEGGLGTALIQKKDADDIDFSTVFLTNAIISVLLYVVLFFASPLVAAFFRQPELKWLLRFVGLVLIFNSLGLVPFVKLEKELDFKIIAKSTILSSVLSSIVGITLAYKGMGVWALAIQMVVIYFFRTLLFWVFSGWRLPLIFSWRSFKALFDYGYKLLLSSLLDQVFQNIYLLIIGKFFLAKDLGYYTQAKKLQVVPVETLSAIVGSVTFPTFSKIQNEDEKLLLGFRKTIKMLVFINFPLMLGLAVIAKPLFFYVLGEVWMPAVPYFQLLCISGMFYTLQTSNLNILKVKGRSDLYLKLEVIKKVLVVLGIIIGINWGIAGLIWGSVITSLIGYFVNSYYSGVLINYPVVNQLKDIVPSMIMTIVMAMFMTVMGLLFKQSLGLFISQMFFGALVYFMLSYFVKHDACLDSLKIIKEFMPDKKLNWKN